MKTLVAVQNNSIRSTDSVKCVTQNPQSNKQYNKNCQCRSSLKSAFKLKAKTT